MTTDRPTLSEELTRRSSTPLHLRHLLQYGADCRCIAATESAFHRFEIDALGGVEDRRRQADFARIIADDLHIFVPHRNLHCNVIVAALCHHRRTSLDYAGISGAGPDQIN